ncbi:MAG: transcriptional regulator [Betaproteobacteria bacterium HGW-Betaproteobacteria-4]|nr:MAG: transcriptional regulator [Betaproteobacteria bacterium HGW-Betaproteobacteria-4]
MCPSNTNAYPHVQGLSRGLALLKAINFSSNGRATIASLSEATGLPRPTVRRLLETLEAEGYVRKSTSDRTYRLNQKIRQLSDGFTDEEWISEIASPILGELLQKIVWPSDLCTIDGTDMLVRETTHRFSPLSFHRARIRQRMPILLTSAGRAYLAYCDEQERRRAIRLIAAGNDAQAGFARNSILVDRLLEKVRHQGYASNDGDWNPSPQVAIGAIAIPVRHKGTTLAAINVVFLKKAISIPDAAQKFLPDLIAAVQKIETTIDGRLSEQFSSVVD